MGKKKSVTKPTNVKAPKPAPELKLTIPAPEIVEIIKNEIVIPPPAPLKALTFAEVNKVDFYVYFVEGEFDHQHIATMCKSNYSLAEAGFGINRNDALLDFIRRNDSKVLEEIFTQK